MANVLTFTRIVLIIPFAFAFLANVSWNMKAALAIFIIAAITDFFDGYVARTRGETSALGAALDPLADKLLVTAALILLTRNGVIHGYGVIAVLVIILRELIVSGLREALGPKGTTLRVTVLAKWKTTAQLAAAGLLLAAAPLGAVGESLRPAAGGVLWLAAVLTAWTGAGYIKSAFALLKEPNDSNRTQ
ncbi:CDP-diacylglycerol--glycerol-3-phosphate 3-phosphatidyltransferase [Hyphococcus flavus]|uniref:CDP-diacylglycerol--glycerol-3-phosphate 3-phosphatidyltransferase n=1 Tax=Hyphococcus flavus TaxID=1866326 RepID=A0AAE9ZAD3_9PROT|nr:CDP-diacylglycerol--glycerol-3-phosphate 3-phosphatidyltransferase [Hyphococcus flavus]WDI30593.1 CDP-diacylglycerol--glycerol-3-phosphate 3-phosphatidyltransferase [Hyphococcus flavus]